MINRLNNQSGLTLLDLLISMVLLTVILSVVYFVFANQERAVASASQHRDIYGQGRMILDLISRDVTGAWLPGESRLESKINYAFKGREDRLDFLSSSLLSPTASTGLNLTELGYRIVENEDDEGYALIRRQDQFPDDDVETGGSEIVLTRKLTAFKFSYIDRFGLPLETWESDNQSKLPAAIKVDMTLALNPDAAEGEKGENTFTTTVGLALGWPKVQRIELPAGLGSSF